MTTHIVSTAAELAAVSAPSVVKPGDTVLLNAGTYAGSYTWRSSGRPGAPIIVQNAPGQNVVLDRAGNGGAPNLRLEGTDLVVREHQDGGTFRITNTNTTRDLDAASFRPEGVRVAGTSRRTKLINLRIDNAGGGVVSDLGADANETYGLVITRCGWDSPTRGSGHGIYPQNSGDWRKAARHCAIANGYGHGIHLFGGSASKVQNYDVEDCVVFNTSSASHRDRVSEPVIFDGDDGLPSPVDGVAVRRSVLWQVYKYPEQAGAKHPCFRIGGGRSEVNGSLEFIDNWVYGGTIFAEAVSSLRFLDNKLRGASSPFSAVLAPVVETWRALTTKAEWDAAYDAFRAKYPENDYRIIIAANEMPDDGARAYANEHERGRGLVSVVNGSGAPIVMADLSSICEDKKIYELTDIEAPEGETFLFRYRGAGVPMPMIRPPATPPIGGSFPPDRATGVYFASFLVREIHV